FLTSLLILRTPRKVYGRSWKNVRRNGRTASIPALVSAKIHMAQLRRKRFRRGDLVTFSLPPGWLDGPPEEDQEEILARAGQPVSVQGHGRRDGCAELEWRASRTRSHTIWLRPDRIKLFAQKRSKAAEQTGAKPQKSLAR